MLEPGDPAPEITAANQYGEDITPTFDEPTVVYFYPKDFTGGCTIEANDFQDLLPQYREAGIAVYGVSMDDVDSHAEFADEEGILFDLLADPDGAVAEAFGLDTTEGTTDRRTFVLADGAVFATYDPELADPAGHAREVLNDTRNEFITGG
ncbi:peroxiredoxin [Halohasta litorea]|uniref:thioredoxin-dependent peroxiredoxin n=1 Tax=Halohasta litorea TaxID=869891 RepID=A0ABD6D6P6_9EURY|nr:peroxiredoxin [Halohasta litorea]